MRGISVTCIWESPLGLKAYSRWERQLTNSALTSPGWQYLLDVSPSQCLFVTAEGSPWLAQAHFADSSRWSHLEALEWEAVVWSALPPHREFCNLSPILERLGWFYEALLCFLLWGTIISSLPGCSVTGLSSLRLTVAFPLQLSSYIQMICSTWSSHDLWLPFCRRSGLFPTHLHKDLKEVVMELAASGQKMVVLIRNSVTVCCAVWLRVHHLLRYGCRAQGCCCCLHCGHCSTEKVWENDRSEKHPYI